MYGTEAQSCAFFSPYATAAAARDLLMRRGGELMCSSPYDAGSPGSSTLFANAAAGGGSAAGRYAQPTSASGAAAPNGQQLMGGVSAAASAAMCTSAHLNGAVAQQAGGCGGGGHAGANSSITSAFLQGTSSALSVPHLPLDPSHMYGGAAAMNLGMGMGVGVGMGAMPMNMGMNSAFQMPVPMSSCGQSFGSPPLPRLDVKPLDPYAATNMGAQMSFGTPNPLAASINGFNQFASLNHLNSAMSVNPFAAAGAFLRYMRTTACSMGAIGGAPGVAGARQEFRCLWLDKDQPEPKTPCGKLFASTHDIVTHLSVEHVGGPEQVSSFLTFPLCG